MLDIRASLLPFALTLALAGCFRESAVEGGTETETTLAGRITDAEGRPAAGAEVLLLPADYNPILRTGRIHRKIADGEGRYAFSGIDAGRYNIQAEGRAGDVVLVQSIVLDNPAAGDAARRTVPDAVLRPACRLLVPWNLLPRENGWVYLPGTTVSARISSFPDSVEGLVLEGVPTAVYSDIRASSGGFPGENILKDSLAVTPGDTVRAPPFIGWRHSRRVVIHPADAGIVENVAGYPLLLRLDSGNFPFGSAAPDGADLRFTSSGNRPLPYQIERWDATGSIAEIWIRIDTVFAGRRDQILNLHFGNPDALPESSGPGVFGSRDGFLAVWHLDESSPGIGARGAHRDAGDAGLHGDDQTATDPRPGIAGRAQGFNGVGDFIDLPASSLLLPTAEGPFTLTAWFKADPDSDWASRDARILDIHRSDTNGSAIAVGMGRGQRSFYYNHSDRQFRFSADTVSLQQWHMVGLAFDGREIRYYLDGVPAAEPLSSGLLPGGSYRAKIGKYGDTPVHAFPGAIDEARAHHVARSADWMRLDFAVQKPGSALVSVLP